MKHLKTIFACMLMVVLSIGQVWAVDISFGYAQWDGVTASFSGTTKDEVTQTVNDVVVTYTRNGASLYANQNALRFYQKNTLKFEAPSGYNITSITFTGSGWKDDVTTDVATCTSSTSALSWSGEATSVTFTRPNNASSYATLTGASVTLAAIGGGQQTTVFLTPFFGAFWVILDYRIQNHGIYTYSIYR